MDFTDIGICTLVIICNLVDPVEMADSIVLTGTWRMPSATILMAAGAA